MEDSGAPPEGSVVSLIASPRGARLRLLGCPIDAVDMDEAVERCERAVGSGSHLQQASVNASKVVTLADDSKLREMIDSCGLVTADGQSVVWVARLLGVRLPERVAGIDLMARLLAVANEKGYRVYVLGAKREVLDTALARLRERYPRLTIAGARDGYYEDTEVNGVCDEIRAARPDILFVAMSSPRKEHFLGEHGESLGVPFAMGVGGSIDVIAGLTRRAPRIVQRLGLEWAYRLLQEPRRLGSRYLRTNGRFAWMVLRAFLTRRVNEGGAAAPSEPSAATEKREPSGRPG
jgi:N-acetylglucosaminyldiphosphoundecaprenol N-acetyl-beta-D-mannosaminyltransferase